MEAECRRRLEGTHDPETNVVVLTGAGGDLDEIRCLIDQPELFFQSMLDCPKPIIAKSNGHAMGLGATVALLCDICFAANHAKIADPHVLVGFTAGDGGAVIWPQLIGHAGLETSIAYEALSHFTRDHREAVDAMAEKRKPQFTGN